MISGDDDNSNNGSQDDGEETSEGSERRKAVEDENRTDVGPDDKTIVGNATNPTIKARFERAKQNPPSMVLLIGPSRQVGKQWQILKSNMVIGRAMEAGLLVCSAGEHTLRLLPPLVMGRKDLARGLALLEGAVG